MDKKILLEKKEQLEKEMAKIVEVANLQIAKYQGAIEVLNQLLSEEESKNLKVEEL